MADKVHIPGLSTSSINGASLNNRDGNYLRVGEHILTVSSLSLFESQNGEGKVFAAQYLVKDSQGRSHNIVSMSERAQGMTEDTVSSPHRTGETVTTVWKQKFKKEEQDRFNSNIKTLLHALKSTLFNLIALDEGDGKKADADAARAHYANLGWDMSQVEVTDNDIDNLLSSTWTGAGCLPAARRAELEDMFKAIPVKAVANRILIKAAKSKDRTQIVDADIRLITSFHPVSKEELAAKLNILFVE